MPHSMERELKLALVEPDHLPLMLAVLPDPTAVVEQTNHYFVDPEGLLQAQRVMVRVRESRHLHPEGPTTVELTVKRRLASEDGYFVADERECALDPDLWRRVLLGERDLSAIGAAPLAPLSLSVLIRHGTMRNVRHVIPLGPYTLEVDRTELPGGRIDAEVEVETHDPEGARRQVTILAERAGVSLVSQTLGKYARFIEASRG